MWPEGAISVQDSFEDVTLTKIIDIQWRLRFTNILVQYTNKLVHDQKIREKIAVLLEQKFS